MTTNSDLASDINGLSIKNNEDHSSNVVLDDMVVENKNLMTNNVIEVTDLEKIEFIVKTIDNRDIDIEARKNDRINDIWAKIKEKVPFDENIHGLQFENSIFENENGTLESYGIKKNTKIRIIEKPSDGISLTINPMFAKSFSIKIQKHQKILDLKKEIVDELHLSPYNQRLFYQDKILENEKSVGEYNIEDHDELVLIKICEKFPIYILSISGRFIQLKVTSNKKIIDIKTMVYSKSKFPEREQVLEFEGTILENEKCIDHYKIVNNSVINNVSTFRRHTLTKDGHDRNIYEPKNEQLGTIKSSISDIGQDGPLCKGICCIINNENYPDSPKKRFGTEMDVENLRSTFGCLGYTVEVYNDVKSTDMNDRVKNIKDMVDKRHRMLIIFFLSHGIKNKIVFTDNEKLKFESIWSLFTNKSFPTLAGKPKVFFFVCCQGSNKNFEVEQHDNSNEEDDSFTELEGDGCERRKFPEMANFFFGYSTVKTYKSTRNKKKGTIYIRTLCDVLQNNSNWSISDIHQEVQRQISATAQNDGCYQMPCFMNMLTEHAYF